MNEQLMKTINNRVNKGEIAKIVCKEYSVLPQYFYNWRTAQRRKGERVENMVFHDATKTDETSLTGPGPDNTSQEILNIAGTDRGFAVFGTASFIKTFVEQYT